MPLEAWYEEPGSLITHPVNMARMRYLNTFQHYCQPDFRFHKEGHDDRVMAMGPLQQMWRKASNKMYSELSFFYFGIMYLICW